jgi:hypothetical protein
VAGAVLDAISLRQDGRTAAPTTIARKRSVFANVLRYAVEVEELTSDPLLRLSWKPPKVSETVDRRVVVNPRQARELLTAVTYIGTRGHGQRSRGQRLMALYACSTSPHSARLKRSRCASATATSPIPAGVF